MLTATENELLTRVGSHTPMGQLIRQYWIPALLSSELPHPDAPPVRVMLLGEKLIAFRDSENRIGLVTEKCPHRGVSLFFGQNKDCGLRCPFHGWKFDVHGQCTDMPLNPNSKLKDKIKIKSYPCQERNGLVWTYMGPRETPPAFPEFLLAMDNTSQAFATYVEGNWLQHLEGDLDHAHFHHLHKSQIQNRKSELIGPFASLTNTIEWLERSPEYRFEVMDTPAGLTYIASDKIGTDQRCYGIGQFLFPFFAMLPQGSLGAHWLICRVPMDDYNTMCFSLFSHDCARIFHDDSDNQSFLLGKTKPHFLPNTTDWFGRFRYHLNLSNDFGIDRRLQQESTAAGHESGLQGLSLQDYAMTASMGAISDRTQEHLVEDDIAIIRVRRQLLKAVKSLQEHSETPPGVDQPEAYRMKHGGFILPSDRPWTDMIYNIAAKLKNKNNE